MVGQSVLVVTIEHFETVAQARRIAHRSNPADSCPADGRPRHHIGHAVRVFRLKLRHVVPLALVVAGVLIASVPTTQTRTIEMPDGTSVSVSFRCVAPALDVLGFGGEEAGWFAYAPNSGATFAPSSTPVSCRPEAYWRTGAGAALVAAGVALAYGSHRARRPQPQVSQTSP